MRGRQTQRNDGTETLGENGDIVRKNKRKNGERKENNIPFSSTSQLLVKLLQLMHPGTISRDYIGTHI